MNKRVNMMDFDHAQLKVFFEQEMNQPAYRATQLFAWVHKMGITDFDCMSNLSKPLRAILSEKAVITLPEVETFGRSKDGTCKWLIKLHCGNCIETVYIPEKNRGTLCVSSQVGCALNCSFCSTGKQGFNRNLSTGEIIAQLWIAVRALSKENGHHDKQITNIVMMGMGEPLLNFAAVVSAMDIMMDDHAYGLSKKRVTLSTSGIIPAMLQLREKSPVALAVSLHAPNDELRNELVPVNKKYPLAELMNVCKTYFKDEPKRKVTFEYVMLDGINDKPEHAKQLIGLLQNIPAKVNLIPFNPFQFAPYKRSSDLAIDQFRDRLIRAGINTITRRTRGEDIDAACGQLAGEVNDRTSRSARWQKLHFSKNG